MKPTLAQDFEKCKLAYPLIAQPKIDGVRACYINKFTGRSLKPFKNQAVNAAFSDVKFKNLDGELAVGDISSASLCRDTTSVLNTVNGSADGVVWHVFDITDMPHLPYETRYRILRSRVAALEDPRVVLVPMSIVQGVQDVHDLDAIHLEQGMEGTILRNPNAPYKDGRSGKTCGSLVRVKQFADAEATVVRVVEAMENQNEAKVNELGHTERSSHQENKIPKGMVGALECVTDDGQQITVGPGKMTHEERTHYWNNQNLLVGQIIKYKSMVSGVKDKPRFPTFLSLRMEEDV